MNDKDKPKGNPKKTGKPRKNFAGGAEWKQGGQPRGNAYKNKSSFGSKTPPSDSTQNRPSSGSGYQKSSPGSEHQKSSSGSGYQKSSPGSGYQKSSPGSGRQKPSPGANGKKSSPRPASQRFGARGKDTPFPSQGYPRSQGSFPFAKTTPESVNSGAVPGRNAVRELLKSGRDIEKVFVCEGNREGSITVLVAETISRGIPLIETTKSKLDALCGYERHQGIVAVASEQRYVEPDDLLAIAAERGEAPLIIIADGITDPHNLGAVIRCAEGAGAHGLILPKRRASGITPAVVKASAGATEHLAVAKCANIADIIRKLKEKGLWIFAAEAGGTDYKNADLTLPGAIVFGNEEHGVSDVVKKNCDFIISIPMLGRINSLNVSTAAAVILYEAVGKRSKNKAEV